MTDTAQVNYKHSSDADDDLDFFTNNLRIEWSRPTFEQFIRPDEKTVENDADFGIRTITCTAQYVTAADVVTINGWLMGSITYGANYPQLTVVTLDSGNTLTAIKVAMVKAVAVASDAQGKYHVDLIFKERLV